ncbi:hypothetical protein CSX11_20900 [Mycobacterium goodii]|nr:hypothetical protein CSX11_20900 [Mycolicibacterium goodii]
MRPTVSMLMPVMSGPVVTNATPSRYQSLGLVSRGESIDGCADLTPAAMTVFEHGSRTVGLT